MFLLDLINYSIFYLILIIIVIIVIIFIFLVVSDIVNNEF